MDIVFPDWGVATFHPSFIARNNRRYEGKVLKVDIQRALDLARGEWKPYWDRSFYTIKPSFKTARTLLRKIRDSKRRLSFDIETDGRHPLVCVVRCLAFYNGQTALCVPFLYRDGSRVEIGVGPIKTCTRTGCGHTGPAAVDFGVRGDMRPEDAHDITHYQPQCYLCRVGAWPNNWPRQERPKVQTWKAYWPEKQRVELMKIMQDIFDTCPLDTQNGQYDRGCMEPRSEKLAACPMPAGVDRVPVEFVIPDANAPGNFDMMLGHHVVASYFPHRLEFLACVYTEAPYYKTTDDGDAWSAGNDTDLWNYNCDDVVAQYTAATKIREEVQERPEDVAIYEHDSWYEAQGQRWKKTGVRVDWRAVELFRHEYGVKQTKALAAMREILEKQLGKKGKDTEGHLDELKKVLFGKLEKLKKRKDFTPDFDDEPDEADIFNPASLAQLRLLLRHLGVPLTQQTATGDISTAKDFLLQARKELKEQGLAPDAPALAFLDFLFSWRECAKLSGTYLFPVILPDGRLHASFSYHIVPSGRLTSSGPNFQNQPKEIRGIFIADDGYYFVAGDWDAGELRISAFTSKDKAMCQTFIEYDAGTGPKPHIVNASILFGLECNKELPDKFPGCYRAAKVFVYLLAYGGGPKTCYDKMRDEMPDLSWDAFLDCFTRYKAAHVELFNYQRDIVLLGTSQHYLDSPILKRRTWFHEKVHGEDSPEASVMQNSGPQSGLSDIVGLANRRLDNRVVRKWRSGEVVKDNKLIKVDPKLKRLGEGEHLEQLCQVHDELMYEVPIRLADEFCKEFKTVTEEPAAEIARKWNMPVDVKVKTPKRKGAHSRWEKVQGTAPCCGKASTVDYDARKVKATDVSTRWHGECENKKCKSFEKPFHIDIPHTEWSYSE